MNDPLEAQPYYKTEIVTTNLVTGEVKSVELFRTHEPVYTPVYQKSEPVEIFREHYLYDPDPLVGLDIAIHAVPDENQPGTPIGVFKRLDRQD